MKLVNTQCCGMRELDNVGGKDLTAEEALQQFFQAIPRYTDYQADRSGNVRRPQVNFGLVVFTGVVKRRKADQFSDRKDNYGQAFADLIAKEGLGDVFAGPQTENPNTTNTIQCWVWRINRDEVTRRAQRVIDAEMAKQAEERKQKANDARRVEATGAGGGGIGEPGTVLSPEDARRMYETYREIQRRAVPQDLFAAGNAYSRFFGRGPGNGPLQQDLNDSAAQRLEDVGDNSRRADAAVGIDPSAETHARGNQR